MVNAAGAGCVGLDGPAVVVGCGDTAEEIAVQRERIEAQANTNALRVCDPAEAARLYGALRTFLLPARFRFRRVLWG